MSQFNNLPLQEMIRSVVNNATEKLAASEEAEDQVQAQMIGEDEEDELSEEEIDGFTDPIYVEKLAEVCDFIAGNVDNIEAPNRGVLGDAIRKMAEERQKGLPAGHGVAVPGPTPAGSLDTVASPSGEQKYKKDTPKGEDAAASQAGTPMGTAGLPGGATQMSNDMDSAPGQASGSVPTAEYPAAGPFHSGPTKTAAAYGKEQKEEHKRIARGAGRIGGGIWGTGGGLAGGLYGASRGGSTAGRVAKGIGGALGGGALGGGVGYGTGYGVLRGGNRLARAVGGEGKKKTAGAKEKLKGFGQLLKGGRREQIIKQRKSPTGEWSTTVEEGKRHGNVLGNIFRRGGEAGREARRSAGARAAVAAPVAATGITLPLALRKKNKEKTAADVAREKILQKLAGEDVMKSNISTPKSGGPLPGDGVMDALTAEQVPSNPTDGAGYGNPQRSHIQSNQGAIDYTKADAKKPQGKQMKEVLTEPAFSPATDSKIREQLRNAGAAGVKIAGANARELLKQAAAQGLINQETVDQYKEMRKQAQMGGGMGGGAPTPPPAEGGGMGSGMTAMAGESEEGGENPKVQALKKMMAAKKQKEAGNKPCA